MIKNDIHYAITGTFKSDFGIDVTNPIIKIKTDTSMITETNPFCSCEYNVYPSVEIYNESKVKGGVYNPFKLVIGGERIVNISYDLVANMPDFSLVNYKEKQKQIIADSFGIDLADVTLVEEVV